MQMSAPELSAWLGAAVRLVKPGASQTDSQRRTVISRRKKPTEEQ